MEYREPLYLDEVEGLVGQLTHSDEATEKLYCEGIQHFDQQEIDMAHPIYVGALRILAQERSRERTKLTAAERRQWNEAWLSKLTLKRLTNFAEAHPEELAHLHQARRELRSFSRYIRDCQTNSEDLPSLRSDQHKYMEGIRSFSYQPAQEVLGDDGKTYLVHGTLVDAPTGSGKSALAGATATAANISQDNPLLIVVPSTELVHQFSGQIGDDTFRRFAPKGITVGAVHAASKEVDADIVITTIHQFVAHSRNGTFLGRTFGMLIVDEAHTITQPLFKKAFLEEWCSSEENQRTPIPTIGFTATTAYDAHKDAAKVLPNVVQHADLLSHMENGILNAGQFFLINIEAYYSKLTENILKDGRIFNTQTAGHVRQEAIRQCMVDFFKPLIEEGRRGIIFLEAGGAAENARELAALFRTIQLSDGEYITAEALHSQPDKSKGEKTSEQILKEYTEGKIQVITSVGMGGQGLNADFDFVGVSHVDSLLKLRQILGRGTRRSKIFPTTIYAQFLLPSLVARKSLERGHRTFYEALGLDTIEQGLVIGRQTCRRPYAYRHKKQPDKDLRIVTVSHFPENIRRLLDHVDGKIISELTAGKVQATPIPTDYISFDALYAEVADRISVTSARYRLDIAGYRWVGVIAEEGGKRVLKRYYEPGSEIVFDRNKVPLRKEDGQYSYDDLERELGVSRNFLERVYRDSLHKKGVTPLRRLAKNGHVVTTFTEEHKEVFKQEISDIPIADEDDDISIRALASQLEVAHEVISKYAEELAIQPVYKRRPYSDKQNVRGFGWFISPAERQIIIDRVNKYPWAADDEWSASRIAAAAGIGKSILYGRLTKEDHAKAFPRRIKIERSSTREVLHWKQSDALQLIATLKKHYYLPAHLIPYFAVQRIANVSRKIPKILNGESVPFIKLPHGRAVRCIGWNSLRTLRENFGVRNQDFAIDFERLPHDENDCNPDRIVYARSIQLRFLSARRMGNPDGIID